MDSTTLGRGVYSLGEAARLTEIPTSTIRAWFRGRSDNLGKGPVFSSDYPIVDGSFAISFYDLIDSKIVGALRQLKVPMKEIRCAYETLARHLGVSHPFCHETIYTDGKRIFTTEIGQHDTETLRHVVSSQQFFRHVLSCLKRIEYSHASKLAKRWLIEDRIAIDPAIGWGKPVINGTGVTSFVLARQYAANREDADLVAELYRVTDKDVMAAVSFERRYGHLRAA